MLGGYMKSNLLDFITTSRNKYLLKDIKNEDVIEVIKTNKDVQNYLLSAYSFISPLSYPLAIKELLEYDNSFLYNVKFVIEALKYDINLLDCFSHYKDNEQVQLIQMRHYPELILTFPHWLKEKNAIKAVRYNPLVYKFLPEELKNNKKIIKNALSSPLLYSIKQSTMFFDIPTDYQEQYLYLKIALGNTPKLYQNLPIHQKNNARVIKLLLKHCFYAKDNCSYYDLQHILPFVEEAYFKKIDNIIWLAQAFEDTVKANDIYYECTMISFYTFLNNSINQNKIAKKFFTLHGLDKSFNTILSNYHERLYKKDLFPTGLEIEIKEFFNNNFTNLAKSLKSFILLNKIEKKVKKKHKVFNTNSNKYNIIKKI